MEHSHRPKRFSSSPPPGPVTTDLISVTTVLRRPERGPRSILQREALWTRLLPQRGAFGIHPCGCLSPVHSFLLPRSISLYGCTTVLSICGPQLVDTWVISSSELQAAGLFASLCVDAGFHFSWVDNSGRGLLCRMASRRLPL